MAVRVKIHLRSSAGRIVDTVAVLNGGFEIPEPHILLPSRCAEILFDNFRAMSARQEMSAAGGTAEFYALAQPLIARVRATDREGPPAEFRVLASDVDTEALVSDAGIDALGIRIESFAPGRWRLADETLIRDSEAPQYW